MNKEFIPYEQALELKELGFDEECLAWYNNRDIFIQESNNNRFIQLQKNCSAPLYQQAFRFFREKYEMYHTIGDVYGDFSKWSFSICQKNKGIIKSFIIKSFRHKNFYFDTYEEAELACLKKLIEIVKQK